MIYALHHPPLNPLNPFPLFHKSSRDSTSPGLTLTKETF